jgi:glycosyltransferase involved in cell wall biosynthesis
MFDRWTAKWVKKLKPDIVICYENSALHTFSAAKKVNAVCVLDAASIHYESGLRFGEAAVRQDPDWVKKRKRDEIVLADAILTCSALAAQTYVEAGVATDRVFPVPLGTFLPTNIRKTARRQNGLAAVFVGTPSFRKGVDLLLDAFEVFHRDQRPITLTIVGGNGDASLEARAKRLPNVIRKTFVAQPELFQEYADHDCLVLPSRFDSFGMVVAEAMAVGTPALVSDRVGAKSIIEEHPQAGWIVKCNTDALINQLLWLLEHKSILQAASSAAKNAAPNYSWESYRARAVATLHKINQRATAEQAGA